MAPNPTAKAKNIRDIGQVITKSCLTNTHIIYINNQDIVNRVQEFSVIHNS